MLGMLEATCPPGPQRAGSLNVSHSLRVGTPGAPRNTLPSPRDNQVHLFSSLEPLMPVVTLKAVNATAARISKAAEKADRNHDGKLDAKEIQAGRNSLSKPSERDIFSGVVFFVSQLEPVISPAAMKSLVESSRSQLAAADVNHDGRLPAGEVYSNTRTEEPRPGIDALAVSLYKASTK